MKTAISIPERVFRQAEKAARRLGMSRSQLYSTAIAEYLRRHDPQDLTQTIDAALEKVGSTEEGFVQAAARRVLRRVDW